MFSKISRYNKLTDTVITDESGQETASRSLRLLPEVAGVVEHTLEESDRLDHLSYKYYRQPRNWWRICDANAEFKSPRSLLGKDPLKTTNFTISLTAITATAAWHSLKTELSVLVGVQQILFGSQQQPIPVEQIIDGPFLFTLVSGMTTELDNSIYLQLLSTPLLTAISMAGFSISGDIRLEKINDNRWQLLDKGDNALYIFSLEGTDINVFQGQLHYEWEMSIKHNEKNISSGELAGKINETEFTTIEPVQLSRAGKLIAIPTKN